MIWRAIEEVFNTDAWAGRSFVSVAATDEPRLERLAVSGAKLDLITGPKRTVSRRNGETEVECETPVRLRAYQSNDHAIGFVIEAKERAQILIDRKSTRLNSSHLGISYAVFCLKKRKRYHAQVYWLPRRNGTCHAS